MAYRHLFAIVPTTFLLSGFLAVAHATVTLNPVTLSSTTVPTNGTFTVTIPASINSVSFTPNTWRSASYYYNSNVAGEICLDTPNHAAPPDATYTSTITATAPATPGVHTIWIQAFYLDGCGNISGKSNPGSRSATITVVAPTPITVSSVSVANKEYDGTTSAGTTTACSLTGSPGGVTCSGTGTFSTKQVGSNKPVSVTGITLSGPNAALYTLTTSTASTTASITAKALTPSVTVSSKVYDSATTASATCSLTGVVSGDNVTCAVGSASFSSKHVGTSKSVTVSSMSLSGADAGAYTLSSTSATSAADITQAVLTVTAASESKQYDNTSHAALLPSVLGLLGSDSATTSQVFNGTRVGAHTLNPSVVVSDGNSGGNYSVTLQPTTGTISPRPLTVAAGIQSKTYDTTTAAQIQSLTLSGVILGDTVSPLATQAVFASPRVGTAVPVTVSGVSLAGTDADQYSIPSSVGTSGDILARPVTARATALDKTYDGSVQASAGCTISGVLGGDAVSCSVVGASFDMSHVGTNKSVAVSAELRGSDANQYTLSTPSLTATAAVTPRTVTVTPHSGLRKLVGDTDPDLTFSFTPALHGSDAFSGALSRVSGESAGSYLLTLGTLVLPSDYTLVFTDTVSFEIAKKPQTISFASLSHQIATRLPFSLEASATSGLAITFAAVGSCSVTDSTLALTVPETFPGTCTVTAMQAGDDTYLPAADVPVTFAVVADGSAPVIAPTENKVAEATSASGAVVAYTSPSATDDTDGPSTALCTPASGSTFPLGENRVECTATDRAGNTATSFFLITVQDTTDPVISLVGDGGITLTTADTYTEHGATWSDSVDGTGSATATGIVSLATPGVYTVTYSYTDAAGNNAPPVVRTINISDGEAPVFSGVPMSTTVEATSASGAVVSFTPPTALDAVDGVTAVSCDHSSGDQFPLGTTVIRCESADSSRHTAFSSWHVIVRDSTAPALSLTGASAHELAVGDAYTEEGAVWTDAVDGTGTASVTGSVNTALPGAYTVSYTQTDAAGNSAVPVTRTVTVVDRTPPTFSDVPSAITTEATAATGAEVTYTLPIATDAVDGARSVTCTPASGVQFLLGSTNVVCTAQDVAHNEASVTFTVTVVDTTAPSITLLGSASLELFVGESYVEPGASWTDLVDGSGMAAIVGSVDTSRADTYTLQYTKTDTAGNSASPASRTVVVRERPVVLAPEPIPVPTPPSAPSVPTGGGSGVVGVTITLPTPSGTPSIPTASLGVPTPEIGQPSVPSISEPIPRVLGVSTDLQGPPPETVIVQEIPVEQVDSVDNVENGADEARFQVPPQSETPGTPPDALASPESLVASVGGLPVNIDPLLLAILAILGITITGVAGTALWRVFS